MDSAPLTSLSDPDPEPLESLESEEASIPMIERYVQVHLKTEGDQLHLILPKSQRTEAGDWAQVCQGLKYLLKNHEKTWTSQTPICLLPQDRLLDTRQLQILSELLQEAELNLEWVYTSRRQTAVAAVTAGYSVKQIDALPSLGLEPDPIKHSPLADPLYLKTTVRSGVEIRHPGTIIIVGDVNPGGDLIADGDIIIWGTLRGVAHAGAKGNTESRIMALRMEPTQLRIADRVARSPHSNPNHYEPEIAYICPEGIRITQAYNFSKSFLMNPMSGTSEKER